MRRHSAFSLASAFTSIVIVGAVAACSNDTPSEVRRGGVLEEVASASNVSVCHRTGSTGTIQNISASEWQARAASGDYVTSLYVDPASAPSTDDIHFRKIGAAVAFARSGRVGRGELTSAACRITINVAAGPVRGFANASSSSAQENFPVIVDVPDITLLGAFRMKLDDAGRATGLGIDDNATTLVPTQPLPVQTNSVSEVYDTPILVANGHPNGSAANGFVVQGFVFQSGHVVTDSTDLGGTAVFGLRVSGMQITGNRFASNFAETVDLRATSANLDMNYLTRVGNCNFCLAGPGSFEASGNRLTGRASAGIFTIPVTLLPSPNVVEEYTLPTRADVIGTILNNEVDDKLGPGPQSGIRVGALGLDASNVTSTSHVSIQNNMLSDNNFGLVIDAAFPDDNTLLKGDLTVTLGGNVYRRSCQNNVLVAFTTRKAAIGLGTAAYLENSTYKLTLNADVQESAIWYNNARGFGNVLSIDGMTISPGVHQFFDATKICS